MMCDVCGKEYTEDITASTISSACGSGCYNYCSECYKSGREPYKALVGIGIYYHQFSLSFKRFVADPTLAFYKKSVDEFNADVDKLYEDAVSETVVAEPVLST